MNQTKPATLYPPEDQPAVLDQCAAAHNEISKFTSPAAATVFKSWHTFTPDKYWYSWRFNPRNKHKIGDIVGPEYGYWLLVVATVDEENPQP